MPTFDKNISPIDIVKIQITGYISYLLFDWLFFIPQQTLLHNTINKDRNQINPENVKISKYANSVFNLPISPSLDSPHLINGASKNLSI